MSIFGLARKKPRPEPRFILQGLAALRAPQSASQLETLFAPWCCLSFATNLRSPLLISRRCTRLVLGLCLTISLQYSGGVFTTRPRAKGQAATRRVTALCRLSQIRQ